MPRRHGVKMTEHHVIQRFISNSFLSVQSLASNVHCHFLQKSVTLSDGISVVRSMMLGPLKYKKNQEKDAIDTHRKKASLLTLRISLKFVVKKEKELMGCCQENTRPINN